MPSRQHEAVVQVLHSDPQFAAMLLGNAGVRLPSGAIATVADSNLSARDPSTLISDNVLVFEGMNGKMAVVAEVQKSRPDHSRSLSWPAYVCNARAEHDCDVVLMVFALTGAAARASAKTIRTGHPGFDLAPVITGHGRLPAPGGPVFGPQLTLLRVLTGDLDLTSHEARMFALRAIADAPGELLPGYTRLIRALTPKSARADLEELLRTVLKDPFVDGLLDQGRAEGRTEEAAQVLLRVLAARRITVPVDIRDLVMGCTDTARLEAWVDRAATATTIDEIFTD
jgi:hypothetical protein